MHLLNRTKFVVNDQVRTVCEAEGGIAATGDLSRVTCEKCLAIVQAARDLLSNVNQSDQVRIRKLVAFVREVARFDHDTHSVLGFSEDAKELLRDLDIPLSADEEKAIQRYGRRRY